MQQIALDKKSNLEYLEREVWKKEKKLFEIFWFFSQNIRHTFDSQVGLHKFLPRSVLNGMKPKALRKLIQQHFKKVAVLSELECMFKFFDLLRAHYRFDQERFICALGVRFCSDSNFKNEFISFFKRCLNFLFFSRQSSWSIPVELVIGPDLGISYMAHRGGTVVSIEAFL